MKRSGISPGAFSGHDPAAIDIDALSRDALATILGQENGDCSNLLRLDQAILWTRFARVARAFSADMPVRATMLFTLSSVMGVST